MLERIFEQPLRFNESELARSVSHAGDVTRLRQALGKLLRGAQRWRPQPRLAQPVARSTCVCFCCPRRNMMSSYHRICLCTGEPISVVILGGSIDTGADLDTSHDAYFVSAHAARFGRTCCNRTVLPA